MAARLPLIAAVSGYRDTLSGFQGDTSTGIYPLAHGIANVTRRKVVIFCDWPSTSWLVKVLMIVLGFNVISIRAKNKSQEREAAVSAFNDPRNAVQVLVTSF